ncbi:MAG: serine hydrolase, partial [Woeseiaceae bacterium]
MSKRLFCAVFVLFFGTFSTAYAQSGMPVPAAPVIGATSYLLIDAQTGQELASLDPDKSLAPASLTKIMTSYVVFKALEQDQIALEDEVTISEKAWRMPG